MILDVNNNDVIKHVTRLERMSTRALPYAIRNTLNDTAFETRNNQIKASEKQFINRNETFFKSRINATRAKGVNVNNMESTSGVYARGSGAREQPVWNLKTQETGGSLDVGSVPTKDARGGSEAKKIPTRNRLSRAKVRGDSGRLAKKGYIAKQIVAAKTKKLVVSKRAIYRVTGVHYGAGNRISFNTELLYVRDYKKRSYKKRSFIEQEPTKIQTLMNKQFKINIEKQLAHYNK